MGTFTDKVCSVLADKSMQHIDTDALAKKLAPLLEKELIAGFKYHMEENFYLSDYLDNEKIAKTMLTGFAKVTKKKRGKK